jgi:type I restriction enzyme M protein
LIRLEEINLSAWSMGKKLLLICGKEANYTPGDSLFDLQPSAQADWVITQPPWGVRFPAGRVQVLAQSDFLQYGHLERIPSSAGDALWVQHALYHTHESGKIIILLPQGILFRGGYDAKLRDYLLEHDLIETIIALPPGLFRHTGIPAVVLMLNKAKPEAQQGEVRLIDASDLGIPGSPQRLLSEQDQSLIVSLANGEQPQHPSFKAVLLPDIYQNDNVLNISRYIHQQDEMELPKLDEEKQKLQTALKTQQQAQSRLLDLLDLDQGGSA